MYEIWKSVNPDEFEQVQFVCKALKKNTGHSFTTVVHVERARSGSRLIACDGKRLHVSVIECRIPKGDYKPVVKKDYIAFGNPVEDVNFPNWKTVVPEAALQKGNISLDNAGMGKDTKLLEGLSLAFNDFVQKTGMVVNFRWLDDLPKKRPWRVSVHKDKKPVVMMQQRDAPRDTYAVFAPLAKAA